jgi:lysophospholipase L1-like esterase
MRIVIGLAFLTLFGLAGGGSAPSPGELAQAEAPRYLALGDSYTIGEDASPTERWPVQLAALLRQKGVAVGEPEIIARTGWTVAELAAGMDAAAPRGPFDLVTLLIGVNDQYRSADPETYRSAFARMLDRAAALAGGDAQRVVVLSIPDWGVTPFARRSGRSPARIAAEIDRFNIVSRQEARKAGVRFVDITPLSRRASTEPSFLAADGLHYAGPMYQEWARLALPAAAEALSRPRP